MMGSERGTQVQYTLQLIYTQVVCKQSPLLPNNKHHKSKWEMFPYRTAPQCTLSANNFSHDTIVMTGLKGTLQQIVYFRKLLQDIGT